MRGAALILATTVAATPLAAQDFFTLKGHGGPIMDIAVAPTGQITTASFDNAVGVWDGTTPDWRDGHRAAVNTVLPLPDGRVASGGDDNDILIWDGDTPTRLTGHTAKVFGLALSPDGQTLASASWDGTVGLWPLAGGAPRFLWGHTKGVNAVAYRPDGLLYSASTDGNIRLWDPETGQEKRLVLRHGFGINKMILDANQGWLAYGATDGATRIIDLETDEPIRDYTLGRRPILAMALSPDGSHLAVGDGEGHIMVIDTGQWRITRDFKATAHGPVWALAWSPNGQNIHAGGLDPIMYSWPLETLTEHGQMTPEEPAYLVDPDTVPNGQRQFQRKCAVCHTLTPSSARRAGPTLHNLFGRRAGTVEDYKYSATLTGSDIVWTEETVNALFDEGPDHYIPGTKMPMQRITGANDRADLIAYLKSATQIDEDTQ